MKMLFVAGVGLFFFFVKKLGYSIIYWIEILPQRLQLEANSKS